MTTPLEVDGGFQETSTDDGLFPTTCRLAGASLGTALKGKFKTLHTINKLLICHILQSVAVVKFNVASGLLPMLVEAVTLHM